LLVLALHNVPAAAGTDLGRDAHGREVDRVVIAELAKVGVDLGLLFLFLF